MKTNSSSSTTVSASVDKSPIAVSAIATKVVAKIATQGVRRLGSTLGSRPSSAMP